LEKQLNTETIDVIGIGNAIVDVLMRCEDHLLVENGLAKGAMTLIDGERAVALYEKLGPAVEISGGSAANTMVGVASLGGRAAYIGKVQADQLGQVFQHDIRAAGVRFQTEPARQGAPTARCFVLITPDAQRTLQTYLGISGELGPEDIDPVVIANADITYLEGYLFDPPRAKAAFRKAASIAHESGKKVALTLSDAFCVDRHREDFLDLIEGAVDILFANEAEITALFRVRDFDAALQAVRSHCEIAALTRSAKGSVIVTKNEVHVIDAEPVSAVVDTTGAGDLFAAGFLFGLTQGRDVAVAARIGAIAAGEIIAHVGARPQMALDLLVKQKLR
jgi:sugar/nucleoside kinase (ribokinase family)